MKIIIKPMYLVFFLMISVVSCNNEELFIEPVAEVVVEVPEDIPAEDTEPIVNATVPCDFTLDSVQANTTVIINCIMDLGGQTITLPAGVTLVYEGGDIINGTINFGSNNTISGELLNTGLTLSGSTPQMKDPTFNFDPQRWGIVEGPTTSIIALRNRDILEGMLNKAKEMGTTTFKIDKIDAYFEVSLVTSGTTNQNFYQTIEAINVPSDFNLVMTDNTNLRVFPNSRDRYALMAVNDASNVNISGGNLFGDRDEHDYSSGGTHERGHVLNLRSAVNVIVDGVYLANGAGDGIDINSWGFTFQPQYYKPSNNIIIKNCVMDSNRRNNMSITDGFNITVIDNQFLNASIDTSFSTGIAPGFAIDIEAERTRDANGEFLYYEIAKDIYILNNIERGSRKGAFTVHIGYDVLIEGNTTEKGLSYSMGNGVKIINNTLTFNPDNATSTAIKAGLSGGNSESIYNNEISGNIINGYDVGINISNRDTKVFGNVINEFIAGIFPSDIENVQIYDNTLTSTRESSRGVFALNANFNNVTISGNEINVISNPFKFTKCNLSAEAANWKLTVENNATSSGSVQVLLEWSKNIDLINNDFNTNVWVVDSNNINFLNNIINTRTHGFEFLNVNTDISLTSNTITISTDNKECVKIRDTTDPNEVSIVNNVCNN
jgi:hypothetical protein